MNLQIVGDGAFGSFLKELLAEHFTLLPEADNVILAVPFAAYEDVAKANSGKHLINVCSVQSPTTKTCLKYSNRVTSIHPLFGRRTPKEFRNSILTYSSQNDIEDSWFSGNDTTEFQKNFSMVSVIYEGWGLDPDGHDRLMEKTHVAAVMAAKQLQVYVDRTKNIPDHLLPHSFRTMKNFVKTLEDMPKGTIESIMANPYL
jgi:prephenate dehydrogenase